MLNYSFNNAKSCLNSDSDWRCGLHLSLHALTQPNVSIIVFCLFVSFMCCDLGKASKPKSTSLKSSYYFNFSTSHSKHGLQHIYLRFYASDSHKSLPTALCSHHRVPRWSIRGEAHCTFQHVCFISFGKFQMRFQILESFSLHLAITHCFVLVCRRKIPIIYT